MNPNEKKKFTDQFRNPNGSYHIPTWLIVVLFICGGWPIAVCLLIARFCEDQGEQADYGDRNAPQGEGTGAQGQHVYTGTGCAPGKRTNIKKKVNTQKLWMILGIVLCVLSVFELPDSIQYLVWCINEKNGVSYALEDVIRDALWLFGGVGMLLVSAGMRAAARKRKIPPR